MKLICVSMLIITTIRHERVKLCNLSFILHNCLVTSTFNFITRFNNWTDQLHRNPLQLLHPYTSAESHSTSCSSSDSDSVVRQLYGDSDCKRRGRSDVRALDLGVGRRTLGQYPGLEHLTERVSELSAHGAVEDEVDGTVDEC